MSQENGEVLEPGEPEEPGAGGAVGSPRPATRADVVRNRLLAAMPVAEQERLRPSLQRVDLPTRTPVYDTDQPIAAIYFPLDCVVSLVALADGQTAIEVTTMGREGMAGLPAFLGAATSPNTAFVQVPGSALRLSVDDMRRFLVDDGELHDLMHQYTQAVMVSMAQNIACNRLHTTEERAARWLLMTADRVGRDHFPLTQEFLAQMLGVRRPTVSLTASTLQAAGLITYTRGQMTITDRAGLHAASCGCYDLITRAYDELAPLT